MRLLLDTHVLLWWAEDDPALSRRAKTAVADPGNDCLFSLGSLWEMAIKLSLEKLDLPDSVDVFVERHLVGGGFHALAIELAHVARVARLPFHHRDPFDRLLAAQALEEDIAIVTRDPVFTRYGVRRIW
ncbi:MAG: type II toxin-antitoxin system VapC family toxin [Deltaproteobacteria bacterium]|nr:type II toxin-antitoxin system VapC family toxin [Deltaproteobacteria bacterium]